MAVDPHLRLHRRKPCGGRVACDLQGLRLPEFAAGLRVGVAALALGGLLSLVLRRRSGPAPLPIVGLLLTLAVGEAWRETGHLLPGLAAGLILLMAGGMLADCVAHRLPGAGQWAVRAVVAMPGAWLLAERSGLVGLVPPWVRLLVAAGTVVGPVVVSDLDRRGAALGLGPVLLAITIVGVYETVPDTDLVLAAVGPALLLALLAWPRVLASLGGAASGTVGLLCWMAAVGGRGRLSAVIGAIACLGLLAVEPIGRLLSPGRTTVLSRLPASVWSPVAVGFVHLALVVFASRIAGTRHRPGPAAMLALGATVIAVAGVVAANVWCDRRSARLSGRRPVRRLRSSAGRSRRC